MKICIYRQRFAPTAAESEGTREFYCEDGTWAAEGDMALYDSLPEAFANLEIAQNTYKREGDMVGFMYVEDPTW